jgi:predicted lipoprotein with Yx(FWY)xxD motif
MRTSNFRFVAVAAFAAIALAACSSSSKTSSDTTPTTPAPAATTTTVAPAAGGSGATVTAATVQVGNSKFGKILVDGKGMTLYVDEKDKPGAPNCTGVCLTAWPPLVAPASPTYGPGVTASLYTTVTASDGTKQIAVKGFPLYTWMGDKKPGDVTGQDVNGFYVVQTSGTKYDPGASSGS